MFCSRTLANQLISFPSILSPRASLYNKNCSKISQETLLNSVSNDLLPFLVGQSHDNFTLLSVKDVMLFHEGNLKQT
jgi:hypothetical protein